MTTFIDIAHVQKVFSDARGLDVTAIADVSLRVERGDFICLLGPSGCGKSTLLNMIAGFEFPTEGRVTVDGDIVHAPGADRGMVFQQPTLMPWLTVWENVAFHLRLKGARRAERRAQAQRYIDSVGLAGFENHYPSELSGGMAQRVGIARALLLNPRVILMDEPFAALDAQTKIEMQEELVSIWQQFKTTIVFVTHSVDEALVLATRLVVMTRRPGTICETIAVDLPRPRDTTTPAFNDIKRHVLTLMKPPAARC